jgi:hypothetical protein
MAWILTELQVIYTAYFAPISRLPGKISLLLTLLGLLNKFLRRAEYLTLD